MVRKSMMSSWAAVGLVGHKRLADMLPLILYWLLRWRKAAQQKQCGQEQHYQPPRMHPHPMKRAVQTGGISHAALKWVLVGHLFFKHTMPSFL